MHVLNANQKPIHHNYVYNHTIILSEIKKDSLILTFNKYFYHSFILCISTAPYTQSNKSSNVSPSISWVQLFLRLFLIFFKINLIITLGLNSFNAIMPKLSK